MPLESTSSVTGRKTALSRTRKSARYHRGVNPPTHVHREPSLIVSPTIHSDRLASELLHLAGLYDDDSAMSSPEPAEWHWPSRQSSEEVLHDISITVDRRGRMRVIQEPFELQLSYDPISRTATTVAVDRIDTLQDSVDVHEPSRNGFVAANGKTLYPVTAMRERFLRSTLLVEKWRRKLKFPEMPTQSPATGSKGWYDVFDKDLLRELPKTERKLSLSSNAQQRIFQTTEDSEVIERDPPPVPEENSGTVTRRTRSIGQPPKGPRVIDNPARRRQRKKRNPAPRRNLKACPEVEVTIEPVSSQNNVRQTQERSFPQLELTATIDETRTEQQNLVDVHWNSPEKGPLLIGETRPSSIQTNGEHKELQVLDLEISGTSNHTRDKAETTRSEILQTSPQLPCIQSAAVNCDDISNTQQNMSSPPQALPVHTVNPHPFLEDIESDGENDHRPLQPMLQRLELISAPKLPITPSKPVQPARPARPTFLDFSFITDHAPMRAPPTPKVDQSLMTSSIYTPPQPIHQPRRRGIKSPPTPPPSSPPPIIPFHRTRTKTGKATTFNPPARVTTDEDLFTAEGGPEKTATLDSTAPYFIPRSPGHNQHRSYITAALHQFNSSPPPLPFRNDIHTTTIHSSPVRTKTGLATLWKAPTQTRRPREKDGGDDGERLKAGSFSAFGNSEVGMAKLDLSRSPTKRTGTSFYRKAFKPPVAGGTPGMPVVKKVGGVTVTRYPTQAAATAGLQGRCGTRSATRQKTIVELCKATGTAGKRTVTKAGEPTQKRRKTEVAGEGNNFKEVRDAW